MKVDAIVRAKQIVAAWPKWKQEWAQVWYDEYAGGNERRRQAEKPGVTK